MTTYLRRDAQRAQLVADGRKAIELIKTRPIADVLLLVGGSRARLYRAMYAAGGTSLAYQPLVGKRHDPLLD